MDALLIRGLAQPAEIERELDRLVRLRSTGATRLIRINDHEALAVPEWTPIQAKITSRGVGAIPELMRIARQNPPLTWESLSVVAEILLDVHPRAFVIPESRRAPVWVSRGGA
jgi:hypothetical protein